MNMDSNKRRNIGIMGSIGVHIVVFFIIAFTGLLHYSDHNTEDIVEIAFFGGGGGGGSGVEAAVEEAVEEEAAEEEAQDAEEVETEPDAIYQETQETKPAVTHKPKKTAPKAAASAGRGTGHGSGTGSGTGPGSGSGSGGGHGSGHGTGTGSGYGSGISSSPAIPPRLTRSPQPAYPSAEKNAGIEGTAHLRLLVGYEGNVEEVTVRSSSGNANLDAAAVAACYKWRFTSAKNGSGQKIRCYINIPITFRIRN